MDVARAFTFVTEDERWVGKFGIAVLLLLSTLLVFPLIVVIPLFLGYTVGITRNVRDGLERPLPEWDDFGTLFKDGLAILVASLIYTLPFWLLMCIAFVATIGFGGLSELSEDAAAAGIVATFGLVTCLAIIFGLALFVISPAIVLQYVRTGELSACLRFGEVLAITRENIGDVLIAALTPYVTNLVLSTIIGTIAIIPFLGWCLAPLLSLAVYPYVTFITGHLYGQIAAKIDGPQLKEKFAG